MSKMKFWRFLAGIEVGLIIFMQVIDGNLAPSGGDKPVYLKTVILGSVFAIAINLTELHKIIFELFTANHFILFLSFIITLAISNINRKIWHNHGTVWNTSAFSA